MKVNPQFLFMLQQDTYNSGAVIQRKLITDLIEKTQITLYNCGCETETSTEYQQMGTVCISVWYNKTLTGEQFNMVSVFSMCKLTMHFIDLRTEN